MEDLNTLVNESAVIVDQIQKEFSTFEILIVSVLPIAMIVSSLLGFKIWLKVNVFFSFFYGIVMILRPETILSISSNEAIDDSMRAVSSLYGCYEIFSSLFVIFLLSSKDESVFISYLWANIIKFTLILIENYVSVQTGLNLNFKLFTLSVSSCVFVILTNVYFLIKSSHKRCQFHYKLYPINRIAKIDFFLLLIAGLYVYAYPKYILSKLGLINLNEGHESLFRICGIITFSLSITSCTVPSFLFEKDKLRFIISRLVGGLWEMTIICYAHFSLKALPTVGFEKLAALNLAYDIFIIFGYFICARKISELKVQANLSCSSLSNESTTSFNEVSTIVTEEVSASDQPAEECNKDK